MNNAQIKTGNFAGAVAALEARDITASIKASDDVRGDVITLNDDRIGMANRYFITDKNEVYRVGHGIEFASGGHTTNTQSYSTFSPQSPENSKEILEIHALLL